MSEEKKNLESLRLEYAEANNNHRHYSNLPFAVFSVYFAVLGGLVSVAFGIVEIKSPAQADVMFWARIAGLLFTIMFFSFEILNELNLKHFRKVATELEDILGLRQFKTRRFSKMPRAIYFTGFMYSMLIIFWLVSIFRRA
jgi:hypothetical protein